MISLKTSIQLPSMWPGVIAGSAQWQPERESRMRKKMNELLSSDCMWHMCGCCWLKVVVVIAGLKIPGGGCVPLIPYLISRSRGEALNPKHTHTLTHSLANTHMHICTHIPPQRHICTYTCSQSSLLIVCTQSFEIPRKTVHLFANASTSVSHIIHRSMATHVDRALTHKHV